MKDLRNWMSISEVANEVKISAQAIYKAIKSGRIKAEKAGYHILIHRDEVLRFIRNRS